MSHQQIDLSQLALERSAASPPRGTPRRRWIARYGVPAGILVGFFGLLFAAAGARLLPAPSVTVVPVIVSRAEVQQAGTALFRAAGWIEPRPTAVSVAALAPGVIEELLVVEGQQLEQGQPVARLVDVDARLAVRQAEATVATREGELHRVEAELQAAKQRLANPVHLQVQLADARELLAEVEAELVELPFLIEAATARLKYAERNLAGKRAAESAISGRILQQAESEQLTARAELSELQQREPLVRRRAAALQDKVDALTRQLELLIEETRQEREAAAKVESARALRNEARLAVEAAKLMLERTTIRSPISGRVLKLVAAPGTRVMGLEHTAGQSSSTVIEMYDPQRLQVRADVRLEDVPLVQPGQEVEIETASSAEPLRGRVLLATSTANVQKNTLAVKVELIDPPATVRPEMLVAATFMAPEAEQTPTAREPRQRLLIPEPLVQTGEAGDFVWVVDAQRRARRRVITTGHATSTGLVEVTAGLTATDKLIASGFDGLDAGGRVAVVGEDLALGVDQ